MADFAKALEKLKNCLSGEQLPELTGAAYTRKHEKFEAASAQRGLLRDTIAHHLAEEAARRDRPLGLLSAGCGDGALDRMVLEASPGLVTRYTGLDPNADQIAACEAALSDYPFAQCLNGPLRGSVPGAPYDVSYAVHVIYYALDPAAFVRDLTASATPGGLAMLAVAPKSPMNEIAELFWARQGTDALFAGDVGLLLEDRGLEFVHERLDASIPLALLAGEAADTDVVEFTVQADLGTAAGATRAALGAAFEACAEDTPDGRVLEHPVDCFWIRCPD